MITKPATRITRPKKSRAFMFAARHLPSQVPYTVHDFDFALVQILVNRN
jgi:hypothetical protein